jgi:hypothetical protein
MFKNIFSNKVKTIEPTVSVEEPKQKQAINSKHIQKDIHMSFDKVLEQFGLNSARQDEIGKLRTRLSGFKEQNLEIYEKIDKLKRLGFNNTPSAKKTLKKLEEKENNIHTKILDLQDVINKNEALNTLIKEYSLKYPMFKFVSREVMIKIMQKYNLVLGETHLYSKEIPDRALNIIDGFSEEISNSTRDFIIDEVISTSSFSRTARYRLKEITPPKPSDYSDEYTKFGAEQKQARLRYSSFSGISNTVYKFSTSSLKMIAPPSHFEIPLFKLIDRQGDIMEIPMYKLNDNTRVLEIDLEEVNKISKKNDEVLDPIACLEVKGGFIILDAWDEEANIPEIKNENLN